jgi:hypothetical protein
MVAKRRREETMRSDLIVNEAVNGAFLKAESRVFSCYDGCG